MYRRSNPDTRPPALGKGSDRARWRALGIVQRVAPPSTLKHSQAADRVSAAQFALADRLQASVQRRFGTTRWRTHVQRSDGRATLCGQLIGEFDTKHWTRWQTT